MIRRVLITVALAIVPAAARAQDEPAIPSFGTLWRLACGAQPVPIGDRGFVFGRVDTGNSTGAGSGATVEMQWRGTADDSGRTAGKLVKRSVRPDSAGNYAVCGVPGGRVVTVMVHDSAVAAIPVSFTIGQSRIARRDLTLPSGAAFERLLADSAAVASAQSEGGAVLAGLVRDSTGYPLPDVRVSVSGVAGEWRTNSAGILRAHAIPAGAHVVTMTAVGFERERRLAEVAVGDSAFVDVAMLRLMTHLSTVTIKERQRFDGIRADIDQRRKLGFGYRVDSVELSRLPGVGEAFVLPSVHVQFKGSQWSIYMTAAGAYHIPTRGQVGLSMDCRPSIWIDGFQSDVETANSLTKDEIGLIEVFTSGASAPIDYPGSICGVVLIWRKRFISP